MSDLPADDSPVPDEPQSRTAKEQLGYVLSLPERVLRSGTGLLGGVLRESASLLVPQSFQNSRTYTVMVRQMLDFVVHDVGRVKQEGVPSSTAEVDNYVAQSRRQFCRHGVAGHAARFSAVAAGRGQRPGLRIAGLLEGVVRRAQGAGRDRREQGDRPRQRFALGRVRRLGRHGAGLQHSAAIGQRAQGDHRGNPSGDSRNWRRPRTAAGRGGSNVGRNARNLGAEGVSMLAVSARQRCAH